MIDDLTCNTSAHCSLCPPVTEMAGRNWFRVRIGDPHSVTPRIAVCPLHDTAGPVAALPDPLRRAMERYSA